MLQQRILLLDESDGRDLCVGGRLEVGLACSVGLIHRQLIVKNRLARRDVHVDMIGQPVAVELGLLGEIRVEPGGERGS